MAPVLLLSLLLHLAILYGAGRLLPRQGRAEQAAEAVVTYIDLARQKGEEPSRRPQPSAPVAAVPAPVSPHAAVRRDVPAAQLAEAPRPSPTKTAVPAVTVPAHTVTAAPGRAALLDGTAVAGAPPVTGATSREGEKRAASARATGTGAEGATSGGRSRELRGSYQAQLKRLIEAHKEYPLAARKSGREGSCRRRFVLRRDGALQQVEAVSSCGHPFLDAAASRAVSSVGSFPPPPAELSLEEPFEVTITFALAAK